MRWVVCLCWVSCRPNIHEPAGHPFSSRSMCQNSWISTCLSIIQEAVMDMDLWHVVHRSEGQSSFFPNSVGITSDIYPNALGVGGRGWATFHCIARWRIRLECGGTIYSVYCLLGLVLMTWFTCLGFILMRFVDQGMRVDEQDNWKTKTCFDACGWTRLGR